MSTEQPDGPSHRAVANSIAHALSEADGAGLGDTLGAAELAGKLAVLRMAAEGSVDVEAMRAASRAARAARGY